MVGTFYDNGRSITEHLGHSIENLSGVVPNSDDGIGSELLGMSDHLAERVGSRAFAEIREERDVAADQRLQRPPIVPKMDRDRTMMPRTTPLLWTMR